MWTDALPKHLLIGLGASIAGMWWAAGQPSKPASVMAAALAAAVLMLISLQARRIYRSNAEPATETTKAAATNATHMAFAYGWGGLAMLAVYLGTDLKWQHGWQYGSGMLLIAATLLIYAAKVHEPGSLFATTGMLKLARALTLAQAGAAFIALAWLIASGKLATIKNDWAANHIFVAGGLAIIFISVLAIIRSPREPQ
ncbi:MAG: hypothetical protein ACK5KM_15795 [Hyphomicrobiaceae bacterium]